ELAHDRAAHESKHAAEKLSGRTPRERVDGAQGANAVGHAGGAGNAGRTAEIMENKRYVCQIERLGDRREGIGGPLKADFVGCHAVALSAARRVEANAPEFVFESQHDIAPYKGPKARMDEEQGRPAPDIRHRDPGAVNLK